jgi:hypothetical protein
MKRFMLIVIVSLLTGCQQLDHTGLVKMPEKLSDQRFNGKFSHDTSGVVYGNGSSTYKFDGTNHAVHESFQYYASGSKLSYLDFEIEVSNGQFRERLWDNNYSDWSDWEDYHFDEDGDLWIQTLEYKKL